LRNLRKKKRFCYNWVEAGKQFVTVEMWLKFWFMVEMWLKWLKFWFMVEILVYG